MDVLLIDGTAPGLLRATVTHQGMARRLAVELGRHPAGGWQARRPGGAWNLRCHSVAAAILMEAAELFADDLPHLPTQQAEQDGLAEPAALRAAS